MMLVQEIMKNKPFLAWSVGKPSGLSDEAVFEQILNYGGWDDFNKFLEIKGLEESAKIFYRALKKRRQNLRPEIKNYFKLYFRKYASGSLK